MKKIFFLILILAFWGNPCFKMAKAADLTGVSISINPQTAGMLATWVISFSIPSDTKLGHILISLGGHQPDLSAAELFVSGLPQGTPQVGKSNPNCVFNCDDIRYYYKNPVSIKKGTKITFTLNKVQNSIKPGETGINFINVYSSKYPEMVLAFSSGPKLINLIAAAEPDETLLSISATNEAPENISELAKVRLNDLFFQPGSKTTRFELIKDAAKVEDLTLDMIGKEKVVFKGIIDLSKPEAIKFFQNLGDYLTFDKLSIEIKKDLMDYFKVPLEITYYNLPYVWDPDILVNDRDIYTKDKMVDYHYIIYDNKPQVNFTIKEAGKYKLIPHLQVNIQDNQKIIGIDTKTTFSGRISDPKAKIKIDLNGVEQKDLEIKIDPTKGEFLFSLNLVPGVNLIQIEAISEFGKINKITKVVEYISSVNQENKISEPKGISPLNIAAIILALVAIIFMWIIRRVVKKKR